MKKILPFLISIVMVIYVCLGWFFSSLIIIPWRSQPDSTALKKYGVVEAIEVITDDNILLKGSYLKNPNDSVFCGIVTSHGWGGNRMGGAEYVPYFWKKGCDIILYDHRGHGDSGGSFGTWSIRERKDHKLFSKMLMKKSKLKVGQIGWIGKSWGAAAVLAAGSVTHDIGFILADSPYKDIKSAVNERALRRYGNWIKIFYPITYFLVQSRAEFDINDANIEVLASKIRVPTLLIHSQSDDQTSSSQSVEINKKLNQKYTIFHHTQWGSRHCKDMTDHPEKYEALIDDFFAKKALKWFPL
jgi:pimeloyl-ACP methyl ester carboxylesterase